MLHITSEELSDLRTSVAALESVLAKLDHIVAGIAAIHVDAAICQLTNNLEVIAEHGCHFDENEQNCPSEYPLALR